MLNLDKFYTDLQYRQENIISACDMRLIRDSLYSVSLFGHFLGNLERGMEPAANGPKFCKFGVDCYFEFDLPHYIIVTAQNRGILPVRVPLARNEQEQYTKKYTWIYRHEMIASAYLSRMPSVHWRKPPGSSDEVLKWNFVLAPDHLLTKNSIANIGKWCRETFGIRRGKCWNTVGSTFVFREATDATAFMLYWQNQEITNDRS